jgi:adenine-specific DNA-methyltransferase
MAHKISEKKQYGVFYTPKRVADIICNWAIKSTSDQILEPSFGGCDFLDASLSRLNTMGVLESNAQQQLFGCDIDENAFVFLRERIPNANGHFKKTDFLELSLTSFPIDPKGFDAVIGNPPYVSHHNMAENQKTTAMSALKAHGLELGGRASLWAYFVLHSVSFLKLGGRMAWVLPSSFLYADYANKVQEVLASNFEKCLVINLHERLFLESGTEEISVITLCENFKADVTKGRVDFVSVSDVSAMEGVIRDWNNGDLSIPANRAMRKPLNTVIAQDLFSMLSSHPDTKLLGDLFDVQIGIVSGANSFFIINQSAWEKNGLPETVKSRVLTKFRFAKGLSLSADDVETLEKIGEACLLFDTTKTVVIDGAIANYLTTFPVEKIATTTTFKRRERSGIWHRFNDNRIPDAFFPYMQNIGTWIVINKAGINSTNSIHRLYRQGGVDDVQIKLAAISILSTFSQLSSELEGRTYGAGVLKHEPSEAVKIRLFMPSVDETLVNNTIIGIDGLLRQRLFNRARSLADRFLLNFCSDEIRRDYVYFEQELISMQNKRMPLKKRTPIYAN